MSSRSKHDPSLPLAGGHGLAAGLALAAALFLFVGMPVVMTIANKSAPLMLAVGAAFANLAALAAVSPRVLLERYRVMARTGTALLFGFVACLAVASLAWTIDTGATTRGITEALPELLFGWALAAAWPLVLRPHHFGLLKFGLIAAAVLILFEASAAMPLHRLVGARAEYPDLKRSAVPLVILLWPSLDYCFARGERLWALLQVAAALAAALAAHSSASVLAVVLACAVYAAARFAPRAVFSAAVAVAFGLVLLAPWTGTLVNAALSPHARALLSEQHADIRIGLWRNFEGHVADRLWFGHGFNASSKVANEVDVEHASDIDMTWNVHPHNAALQIWVELGIVGVLGLTAAISFCAWKLARLTNRQRASRLAFTAANAAVALVGLNAWIPWWLAVATLGLVCFAQLRNGAAA